MSEPLEAGPAPDVTARVDTADPAFFAAELGEVAPALSRRIEARPENIDQGLARLVPDHADVDTWACGPAGLIDRVRQAMEALPRSG